MNAAHKIFITEYVLFILGDTLFSVSPTGQVTVTGTLDRETTETYSISIRVCTECKIDNCFNYQGEKLLIVYFFFFPRHFV